MPSLNAITILGNLGRDPELRYTPDGKAVCNINVAVTRAWPDAAKDTGWAEETVWFRVDVWEQRGERLAERAKKGDMVLVQGRVKPVRVYTRQDGTAGASLEIHAQNVVVLGRREQAEDGGYGAEVRREEAAQAQPTDEQLVAATGGGTVTRAPAETVDLDDIPF